MDWAHVLALLLGNLAIILPLFLWNRAESRSDMRHVDAKLDSQKDLIGEIQTEMKDFHARLCVLEEKYIQMMQRILEKKG